MRRPRLGVACSPVFQSLCPPPSLYSCGKAGLKRSESRGHDVMCRTEDSMGISLGSEIPGYRRCFRLKVETDRSFHCHSDGFLCFFYKDILTWKKSNSCPNVGGVSVRSGNGAPSRKGCMVNGQTTRPSNTRGRALLCLERDA